MTLKQIVNYIRKDWSIDWRNKFSIGGVLLYIATATFIVFLSFSDINAETWNSLFWIILLFGILNGVVKSFSQEGGSQGLYYFQIVDPLIVLVAKIIYNFLLTLLMSILTFTLLSIFSEFQVEEIGYFVTIVLLGSFSLSVAFTFISGIATQGKQSATLMAILGLPVVIPIILILVKLSRNCLGLVLEPEYSTDFMILTSITLILLGLSIWLFPFIWKE